jgi:hypothetical protein
MCKIFRPARAGAFTPTGLFCNAASSSVSYQRAAAASVPSRCRNAPTLPASVG